MDEFVFVDGCQGVVFLLVSHSAGSESSVLRICGGVSWECVVIVFGLVRLWL